MQKMKDLLNEELKAIRKEFYKYFNEFYGKNGLYSCGRNITSSQIDEALEQLNVKHKKQHGTAYAFYGDTVDRENVRDILFTEEQLQKMYFKNSN